VRSAFAPVAVALVAVLASLVRWMLQGSSNIYPTLEKTFYVPDPDVGWAISDRHPIWLGLLVVAIFAAVTVGLALGGWIIRRRERKTGAPAKILRGAAWGVAVLLLVVPIAAFATGGRPDGGVDVRPQREPPKPNLPWIEAAAPPPPAGQPGAADKPGAADALAPAGQPETIAGSLDLPAGRYEVVGHKLTEVAVRLSAGGDTFDARFAERAVTGEWRADPKDLTQPMTAEVSAAAAQVDTGIAGRSKHAREGFLKADKFPKIVWKLDRLVSARQDGPDRVAFRALGTVTLLDKTHQVPIEGSLKKADAAAQKRLKLTGAVLIAEADFSLVITETALAPDASTFKGDRFPIHISLVLRHTSGT
jgi:polyisoprenoid-binding protein YceI